MKSNVMKIILASFFVIPFLFINENNVDAATFRLDNRQVYFDYSDISNYLVRVGGVLEITYVDLEGNKSEPITVDTQLNGRYYLDQNGTYTIRQLLPNGRHLGQSFYQTIVTNVR